MYYLALPNSEAFQRLILTARIIGCKSPNIISVDLAPVVGDCLYAILVHCDVS